MAAIARFQTIVYPTDFSPLSCHALQYALSLARQFDSQLHCIHVVEIASQYWLSMDGAVVPPNPPLEDLVAAAEAEMAKFISANMPEDIALTKATLTGRTFLEIIQYARRVQADLIVMGTHGRSAIKQMLLGRVAEKVVRKSVCPVLTVRHPDLAFEMT